jgi:hypothetical protein
MKQNDTVNQSPSRRGFIERQEAKTAQRPANYLPELRLRITSLTKALADTGRMSHAKRASLENQLKQAVANMEAHTSAPKKAESKG